MDKEARNRIQQATQAARSLLEDEYTEQLEGTYDLFLDGTIASEPGQHLSDEQRVTRRNLVAAIAHERSSRANIKEAISTYCRGAAFTLLNRFVALKMLEARGLVQECVSEGDESAGFKEFAALALGLTAISDKGYRIYIESIFDEIGQEVQLLFDRRDPSTLLWPRRQALQELLAILNDPELDRLWAEDETIGWVYQYFNSDEERKRMRSESSAPRNSHELAVRNQFFTPRYVVQFLTENTLGRIWYEMRQGDTQLRHLDYLVTQSGEHLATEGERAPLEQEVREDVSGERATNCPASGPSRAKKDPRDIGVLDPACGSGHFLLYAFDMLLGVYEEAWQDIDSPPSEATGRRLVDDYENIESLRLAIPGLILRHNLHGIDIDARCAQIAALALWIRAQRAYAELGIARAARPAIRKTNVVVAESMPDDEELRRDLVAALNPTVAQLVEYVFERMELAGEAGSLLRIEDDIRDAVRKMFGEHGQLFRESDEDRWRAAEDDVLGALHAFAEATANGRFFARRLFADDAARGFAYIDVCRKRYDVVLMNPPFGAPTPGAAKASGALNKDLPPDLYCWFLRRAESFANRGVTGAITSGSFLLYSDYSSYRLFLAQHALTSPVLDLGWGVLDAYVRPCAYCVDWRAGPATWVTFVDLADEPDREIALREVIRDLGEDCEDPRVHRHDLRTFLGMEGSPFCYWLTPKSIRWITDAPKLQSLLSDHGIGAGPHKFFFRLRWELPFDAEGDPRGFPVLSNGGAFSPFFRDNYLHIAWGGSGRQIRAHLDHVYPYLKGNVGLKIQREHVYLEPGLTYGKRTERFNAQVLRAGAIPSFNGIGLYPADRKDTLWLLAYLNSKFVALFLNMTCGLHKNSTYVDRIPLPELSGAVRSELASIGENLFRHAEAASSIVEVSAAFAGPALARVSGDSLHGRMEAWRRLDRAREVEMWVETSRLEKRIRDALALGEEERELLRKDQGPDLWQAAEAGEVRESVGGRLRPVLNRDDGRNGTDLLRHMMSSGLAPTDAALELDEQGFIDEDEYRQRIEELLSWLLGCSFKRWKAVPRSDQGEVRDLFGREPWLPPAAMLPAEDSPGDGILVDDPGHEADIVRAIEASATRAFGDDSRTLLDEAGDTLGSDTRSWVARRAFARHLHTYSRAGRKAPVYWQLATPSTSYSVWLYYHRFSPDTLFRLLNDHVTPKLQHEERKLTQLVEEAGTDPSPAQRKEIDAQEVLVEELRAFRDNVTRIAPLWNPNLDDGVIINFAPLWQLVPQHRSWQKECKKVWNKLVEGEYDWAHLAMHLWPERVVSKCAEDRSLAITHGLEKVFWEEDERAKWQSKSVDEETVSRLIEERSSPAVRAALSDLMRAAPRD